MGALASLTFGSLISATDPVTVTIAASNQTQSLQQHHVTAGACNRVCVTERGRNQSHMPAGNRKPNPYPNLYLYPNPCLQVIAVFNKIGVKVDLFSMVFGESVLNDAVRRESWLVSMK